MILKCLFVCLICMCASPVANESDKYVDTIHGCVICDSDIDQMCNLFLIFLNIRCGVDGFVSIKIRDELYLMLQIYKKQEKFSHRDVIEFMSHFLGDNLDKFLLHCDRIGLKKKNVFLFFAIVRARMEFYRDRNAQMMSYVKSSDIALMKTLSGARYIRAVVEFNEENFELVNSFVRSLINSSKRLNFDLLSIGYFSYKNGNCVCSNTSDDAVIIDYDRKKFIVHLLNDNINDNLMWSFLNVAISDAYANFSS